ncbi:MAG: hypothetical protein ACPKQO_05535, partial [Nitrososphaeraceae archaeon]
IAEMPIKANASLNLQNRRVPTIRDENMVTEAICSALSPAKLTVIEMDARIMGYKKYFGIIG